MEKSRLLPPKTYAGRPRLYGTEYPWKDVKVNLRENSNVSTGGDSIDVTDEMPEIYKNIAEKAAEALQVKITGVDILIEDLNDSLGEKYSIIEANFNPAMLFHLYPLKGKGRRVTMDVLQFLFQKFLPNK